MKLIKTISNIIYFSFCIFFSAFLSANQFVTALVGATIFISDQQAPLESGTVIISRNKITQVGSANEIVIPDNANVIDMTGKFITAGYWNSHVHYINDLRQAAKQSADSLNQILEDTFSHWGFVNTIDTGSWLENTLLIKSRIESGEVNGPRIMTIGGSFVPKGGSPYYVKPVELPEFENPEQVRRDVSETLNRGADGIKLFTGSWATPQVVVMMEPEHIKAATDTAHARDRLVFAHPSDSDGARVAIENGVDVLAHAFPAQIKGPWDRSLINLMYESNVSLVPTLKLWRYDLTRENFPANIINLVENTAINQTKMAHDRGIPIMFGTDVGYMADADTTEELILMERAGMDFQAILASLTTTPAARYGFAQSSGKIQAGYDADLVILNTDPRKDIKAFADVNTTIRNGKIVYAQ